VTQKENALAPTPPKLKVEVPENAASCRWLGNFLVDVSAIRGNL
jgi:hypothetical protein